MRKTRLRLNLVDVTSLFNILFKMSPSSLAASILHTCEYVFGNRLPPLTTLVVRRAARLD